MRKLLTSLAVLALASAPSAARAEVIDYTITNGTLNTFIGVLGPNATTVSPQVGTVSGTFQFNTATDSFQDLDLTYVYQGVSETFTAAAPTTSTYNGQDFYIDFNVGDRGTTAALELTYGLTLCTLDQPCPGINASNYEQGGTNIGSASVSASVTPEPSSLVLFGTGILTAAGAARRKLRKA